METKDCKGRILMLEHYLLNHSDRDHPVTTADLAKACEEKGMPAHRNTLADDLKTLKEAGVPVESVRIGNGKGYFISERPFETTELMAMIDAVASSQFISERRSKSLIRKLAGQAIEQERGDLTASAHAVNRIKTDNDIAISDIAVIAKAIKRRKKIEFQYIDYLPTKEMILRHDGKVYSVSPYTMVWWNGRYYAPSYDEEKKDIVPYRIDRMRNVRISRENADLCLPFSQEEYCRNRMMMFGGNKQDEDITLIAKNRRLGNLIDYFGDEIPTEIADEEHIRVTVHTAPSYTFFSWIFQFGGEISITGPEHVRAEYEELLREVLREQENY